MLPTLVYALRAGWALFPSFPSPKSFANCAQNARCSREASSGTWLQDGGEEDVHQYWLSKVIPVTMGCFPFSSSHLPLPRIQSWAGMSGMLDNRTVQPLLPCGECGDLCIYTLFINYVLHLLREPTDTINKKERCLRKAWLKCIAGVKNYCLHWSQDTNCRRYFSLPESLSSLILSSNYIMQKSSEIIFGHFSLSLIFLNDGKWISRWLLICQNHYSLLLTDWMEKAARRCTDSAQAHQINVCT